MGAHSFEEIVRFLNKNSDINLLIKAQSDVYVSSIETKGSVTKASVFFFVFVSAEYWIRSVSYSETKTKACWGSDASPFLYLGLRPNDRLDKASS